MPLDPPEGEPGGPMRMTLSGSRTEFLSSDTLGTTGDIQYGRGGGCFVSTRRGLLLAAAVVAALIAVGLLVFYLAPCPPGGCRGAKGSGPTREELEGNGTSAADDAGGSGSQTSPISASEMRLSDAVRPRYYNLWLQPFIGNEPTDNFTVKGTVEIYMTCVKEQCSSISLHAKELNITTDHVMLRKLPSNFTLDEIRERRALGKKYRGGGTTTPLPATVAPTAVPLLTLEDMKISSHKISPETDMITFHLEKPMEFGMNYSLEIPYWGNVSDSLNGFYRSNYTDKNGTNRWLAVTHFEPTYARKAFPCFDEPAMKAHFEVHVARREHMTSLSNMPLHSSQNITEQPGWVWDHYPKTPVMSTYLVAVIVSELAERIAPPIADQPTLSVVARPELLHTADYALKVGPQILEHYAKYFNVSYPLPNMTMAAVPDFAAGAMENWGLVIYRESLMLYDPKTSTDSSQYHVAGVVAHELAHQWFGNIVTMSWWTDLWLNEGFATYVSYIGVDHVEPTWNTLEKLVTDEMHPVLETDSLDSTHPVSVEVNNTSQISEVFDDVSYNKGASLIRMLNHSLTEPVFRMGLTSYLRKWAYSNAQQDDLWTALTEAADTKPGLLPPGANVKAVMDTWTLQKGYPLVTVERDYITGSVHIRQRPFSLHLTGNYSKDQAEKRAWYIPLSYATGDNISLLEDTRPRTWLSPEQNEGVTIKSLEGGIDSKTWLLLNIQQTGYYRVNYDKTNWLMLTDHLLTKSPNNLPATSRAQLISDAFNLARVGHLDYHMALNLTLYLERETNPSPWYAFLWSHSFLDDMLRDTSEYPNLQSYTRRLLQPLFKTLGREARQEDSHPVRQLRTNVVSRLIHSEDFELLAWARGLFDGWANSTADTNPVPVDLRYSVYCSWARWGGGREWSMLEERFKESDLQPVERSNLLRALMCTRQTHLIVNLLERSLDESGGIRLQDCTHVWRAAPGNPVAAGVAFRFMRERWDHIYGKYNKISFVLKSVLRSSIAGLSTKTDLEDSLTSGGSAAGGVGRGGDVMSSASSGGGAATRMVLEAESFVSAHKEQFSNVERTVAQAMERLHLRVRWRSEHQTAVARWLSAHGTPRVKQPSPSTYPSTVSRAPESASLTSATAAMNTVAGPRVNETTPRPTPIIGAEKNTNAIAPSNTSASLPPNTPSPAPSTPSTTPR